MPQQGTSIKNAQQYKWGGPAGIDCDGWHLVKAAELSIIEELMPPGTKEERHYHLKARQFFYVLQGEMTLEVDSELFRISAGHGLEVAPNRPHQVMNNSHEQMRMIVISQPPSHGDRISA